MMLSKITSEVDRAVEMKRKVIHTQAAEVALMNISKKGYAAASAGLKDASYQNVEIIITEMTLNSTLGDLFMGNLEW